MNRNSVNVVGAGLAGSEAAFQLARRGLHVRLFEMRPRRMTPAHRTPMFGELVCSNSLRSTSLETAVGVLKEEMRRMGSLVMEAADRARIPAGQALAVDREEFAGFLTATLETCPGVSILRDEITSIPPGPTLLATGPLTSRALSDALGSVIGPRNLYFYDAIAPVVTAESIDMQVAFRAGRYGKGGDDYINCPMSTAEYESFVQSLVAADKVSLHSFEKPVYFEGCVPIEEMARRGPKTLSFGPMKPVGLIDPRTGRQPAAVVQLRQDDRAGRLYNLVGFQTKMTYRAQRRIFRTIPGLEKADFVRLGSLHRNTFIDSPRLLLPTLQSRSRPDLFLAGQMVGVEGYLESAAAGMLAAINLARSITGDPMVVPPPETAIGSLVAYITDRSRRNFQPMNANFGLIPPLSDRLRGRAKKVRMAERALHAIDRWIAENSIRADPDGSSRVAAGLG